MLMQTIKFLVSSFPVKNSSSKLSYVYAIGKPRCLLPSLINERREKEIIERDDAVRFQLALFLLELSSDDIYLP